MGVLVRDLAVGGPARMAEAGRRVGAVQARLCLELIHVPDRADVIEPAVLEQGEAGRVVPAGFEPLEAVEERLLGGPNAYVSDDPAHASSLPTETGPRSFNPG